MGDNDDSSKREESPSKKSIVVRRGKGDLTAGLDMGKCDCEKGKLCVYDPSGQVAVLDEGT